MRGVVRGLRTFVVLELVLGIGFAVATFIVDPVSAAIAIVIMVPLYAWLLHRTTEPRMRAMAGAAREVVDPRRQSNLARARRPALIVIVLLVVMVPLFLWSAREGGVAGVVCGVLLGNVITTFLQIRWWTRWQELYGVEMLYESGWSWREFWKGADTSRCWFVRLRPQETGELDARSAI